jgi:ABC-type phosphate/phosphonate transport system substrate-binding protein
MKLSIVKKIMKPKIMKPVTLVFTLVFSLCSMTALHAADYRVAVRAYQGIDTANKRWRPTMVYLSEQVPGHTFTLIPVISLKEITVDAGRGEYDFVLTNPSSYVEISERYGAKALVTLINKRANTAQDRFGSVIFTHVGNENILRLKDLKGKTLMAVSESAFGGWQMAWLELLKNNIDPFRDLDAVRFPDNALQQMVVYAVLKGEIDAGVVRTDQLEHMEAEGKIDMRYLRILNNKNVKGFPFFLSTDLYPEWALAAMKGVSDKVSQQVKQVLQSMPADHPAARAGKYVGWKHALNYDSVEKLMQELKVGPFAQ